MMADIPPDDPFDVAVNPFLQDMKDSYEEWRKLHTVENRTPREMWYQGYYTGVMKTRNLQR